MFSDFPKRKISFLTKKRDSSNKYLYPSVLCQCTLKLLDLFGETVSEEGNHIKLHVPAIWALYAIPTPHKLLLATPAITPAQLLPCLGKIQKKLALHESE